MWEGHSKRTMKFKIYIFAVILLVTACNSQQDTSENNQKDIQAESIEDTLESKNISIKPPVQIDLPIIGNFDLAAMNVDSTHEYGAGDCFGKVARYSMEHVSLCLDSMSCSEYGQTNTAFLLTPKNIIQVVCINKWTSFYKLKDEKYVYILLERIIDFNTIPATIFERKDTVENYMTDKLTMEFTKDTLTDTQTSYEHWEMELQGIWDAELDY